MNFSALFSKIISEFKLLLTIILLLVIIYHYVSKWEYHLISRKIPGPYWHIPYIGSIFFLIKFSKNPLTAISDGFKKYGPHFGFWINQNFVILSSDAKDVEVILNNQAANSKLKIFYDLLTTILGNGLVTEHADTWVVNRRLIAPTFKTSIINSFLDVTYEKSEHCINRLKKNHGDNEIIDIIREIHIFTLHAYCENFMEINFDWRIEELAQMADLIMTGKKLIYNRMTNFFSRFDFVYFNTKMGKEFLATRTAINDLLKKWINEKQLELNNNPEIRNGKKREIFLPLLFDHLEEQKISWEQFQEEALTLLVAGTDTNAVTMASACVCLGIFQDVQEKMYQEVMEVLGSKTKPITYNDLANLKYVERVLNETMRLFPLTPQIGRHLLSDIEVNNEKSEQTILNYLNNRKFPKGLNILFSLFNLHRSESYWADPLKFDPDRFLPEECAKRPSTSFIPFSIGPRNCMGYRYAMFASKIILTNIVRNFRISSPYKSLEEIELHSEVLISFTNGYSCMLHPRE